MSDDQLARLMDLVSKREELHPDLQDYVETDGQWPMIRHPLCYAVPYIEHHNALLNQSYLAKVAAIQKARFSGDYEQYMWLHERPWRLTAILDIAHEIPDDQWFPLLGRIWTDSENIHQMIDEWNAILEGNYESARYMGGPDDVAVLEALPDRVTIHRGFTHNGGEKGLSWTLDIEIARFFAKRFGASSRIATGVIPKDKILAYLSDRGEAEIIAFHRDVENITIAGAL